MQINAIILESDENAARTLLCQIESCPKFKCVVAANTRQAKTLIQKHPTLKYIFCVYDVSNNEEQLREEAIVEHKHFPRITICSIGSIKKEEVTLSNQKVILFDSDDILAFSKAARTKSKQLRKSNLKLKSEAFKKRGVHVVP